MSINPLSSNFVELLTNQMGVTDTGDKTAEVSSSFADVLSETLGTVAETDRQDKTSALELLTGQTDDMSGLLLDATKAELSLNLALQIRNKVVDAYNEIMRSQV
jgi:flagellar hook-basal body complex protein FliE